MNEFLTFLHLGFRHIVDIEAMDHILFLVALAAIYRFRDIKKVLWVITAFTVGHSITLALAVTGILTLPSPIIEFLIPVTIVATGIENLIVSRREATAWASGYRPIFAGVFGLLHGAGFANYLKALFVEHLAVPLFGFNVGIELGQMTVLAIIAVVFVALDYSIRRLPARSASWQPLPRPGGGGIVARGAGRFGMGNSAESVVAMFSRAWSRVVGTFVVMGIGAMAPRTADAHPLHTTITEIVDVRARGAVQATIRVFLDDFTTAVQHASHRQVTAADGAPWDAASLAYALSAFGLTGGDGHPLALRSCGVKRTDNLLWICLEATAPGLASLKVKNSFLCDLYDDQINVVQATVGTARHSVLFTRGDGAKPL